MALCAVDSRRCSAKIDPARATIAVVEGLGLPEGDQLFDVDGDTPSREARAWRRRSGSRDSVETRAYPTSMRPIGAPAGQSCRSLPTGVKLASAGHGIVSKACSQAGRSRTPLPRRLSPGSNSYLWEVQNRGTYDSSCGPRPQPRRCSV